MGEDGKIVQVVLGTTGDSDESKCGVFIEGVGNIIVMTGCGILQLTQLSTVTYTNGFGFFTTLKTMRVLECNILLRALRVLS